MSNVISRSMTGRGADERRTNHASGRTGKQRFDRPAAGLRRGHDAAIGFGRQHAGRHDSVAHAEFQIGEIALHALADIGVHHRRQGAFIFAHLWPDLGGDRDVQSRRRVA